MTDGPPPRTGGAFRRLLGRPWFAAVAGATALALVVTVAVVAIPRLFPSPTAPDLAEAVPSAFPVSLLAISSPAVDRGETITVRLQAATATPPAVVEVWQDATLLLRIADPPYTEGAGALLLDLDLDVVATQAGQHHLSARVVDRSGDVGQSVTVPTAILDLPADLGVLNLVGPVTTVASGGWDWGTSEFLSIPGDTLAAIAGRLAVPADLLRPIAPLPPEIDSADDPVPTGTRMYAPIASPVVVDSGVGFVLPTSDWLPHLSATVEGCDVVVASSGYTQEVALYSGPELRRVGEVGVESSTTITGLPVGGNVIVGYTPGAKPNVNAENGPSAPIAITVPDECGAEGWTGEVSIVNGVLLSALAAEPEQPYLYVSIDGGRWSRFPSDESEYLPAVSLVDVSGSGFSTAADQVNVELWTGGHGSPERVAGGTFCRARIGLPEGATPAADCRAPDHDPSPLQNTATLELHLVPSTEGRITFTPVAPSTASIALSSDVPVTLDATLNGSSDATTLVLQYSYFPLSGSADLLAPPGVFHEETRTLGGPPGARTASFTVNPWYWRSLHLDDDGVPTSEAGALDLADELTYSTALQLLQNQGGIVTDVYLRVVAVRQTGGYGSWTTTPVGLASAPVHVDLAASDPEQGRITLGTPVIQIEPGRVTPALAHDSTEVSGDRCVTVQSYPEAGTWLAAPSRGPWSGRLRSDISLEEYQQDYAPYYNTLSPPVTMNSPFSSTYYGLPAHDGDILIYAGSTSDTDLERAKFAYPNPDWVYCHEGRTEAIDSAQAAIKAQAIEDAQCTFVCVIQAVLVGALVGFAYGGPYGAIVGAAVGLAVGLTHALAPELYKTLFAFWDKIAAIYNGIYFAVGKLVDTLACGAIKEASATAGSVCGLIASAALAVVWSVYVGTPPYIPTSAVLERIAQGSVEDLIYAGITALGVDCASLTVDGAAATGIRYAAGQAGIPTVDAALAASREGDGDGISVCRAVARIIADQAFNSLVAEHGAIMSSIYQTPEVPGLVLAPYAASSPVIQLSVPTEVDNPSVTACPVVGSIYLKLNGRSLQLAPTEGTLTETSLFGVEFGQWQGSLNIPVPWYYNQSLSVAAASGYTGTFRSNEPAAEGQAFITVDLSSPCFSQVYRVELDGFSDFNEQTAAVDAFYQDDVPIARYYPGYGLTSTP